MITKKSTKHIFFKLTLFLSITFFGSVISTITFTEVNHLRDELQFELDQIVSIIPTSDLIIYSFDRPMQLYALLESVQKYVTGINKACVIYRTSGRQYDAGYDEVHRTFEWIEFIHQGDQPEQDFKKLTLEALTTMPSSYVLFAVDDIVVTDYITITDDLAVLEKTNAYGFYYRLGKNLDSCYSYGRPQKLPPLVNVIDDIYSWQFMTGEYDWSYPHSVDMTLYRKKDILLDIQSMQYRSPNTFESQWSQRASRIIRRLGLCYQKSKIVNLPLNVVQKDWKNRSMNSYTAEQLLEIFNKGLKIDIEPLFQIDNKAAHMEYELTFVER